MRRNRATKSCWVHVWHRTHFNACTAPYARPASTRVHFNACTAPYARHGRMAPHAWHRTPFGAMLSVRRVPVPSIFWVEKTENIVKSVRKLCGDVRLTRGGHLHTACAHGGVLFKIKFQKSGYPSQGPISPSRYPISGVNPICPSPHLPISPSLSVRGSVDPGMVRDREIGGSAERIGFPVLSGLRSERSVI